jgi:hypothetical protein
MGDGVVDEDVVEFFGKDFRVHAARSGRRCVGVERTAGESW